MLTRMLFLLTLVFGAVVVLTGAWSDSFAPAARSSESRFVAQNVPLDPALIGSGINARQLLEKAVEKLAWERTTWLKTKIRQTMTDGEVRVRAEGVLQRGPNHCARLEMNLIHGAVRTQVVIVSDGAVVSQVRKIPGAAPVAVIEPLPVIADGSKEQEDAGKEEYLSGKACGGPLTLLQQLHQRLQHSRLQTGLLDGKAVIQIKGDLNAVDTPTFADRKLSALYGYVYLDAQTLWPCRLEWWGADKAGILRPIVQIDFHDPEIDQPLSLEECERIFSYRPAGDEKVAER